MLKIKHRYYQPKVVCVRMTYMKRYLAELPGTFVLVFIGTASAVVAGKSIGFLGISLAFGISVLVMVYAIGHIPEIVSAFVEYFPCELFGRCPCLLGLDGPVH